MTATFFFTDAGSRADRLRLTAKAGWCWIGRIRDRNVISKPAASGLRPLPAGDSPAVATDLGEYETGAKRQALSPPHRNARPDTRKPAHQFVSITDRSRNDQSGILRHRAFDATPLNNRAHRSAWVSAE